MEFASFPPPPQHSIDVKNNTNIFPGNSSWGPVKKPTLSVLRKRGERIYYKDPENKKKKKKATYSLEGQKLEQLWRSADLRGENSLTEF